MKEIRARNGIVRACSATESTQGDVYYLRGVSSAMAERNLTFRELKKE